MLGIIILERKLDTLRDSTVALIYPKGFHIRPLREGKRHQEKPKLVDGSIKVSPELCQKKICCFNNFCSTSVLMA